MDNLEESNMRRDAGQKLHNHQHPTVLKCRESS